MIDRELRIAISEMDDDSFLELYRYISNMYREKKVSLMETVISGYETGDTVRIISDERTTRHDGLIGVIQKKNRKNAIIVISRKRNPDSHNETFRGRKMFLLRCPYMLLENIEE